MRQRSTKATSWFKRTISHTGTETQPRIPLCFLCFVNSFPHSYPFKQSVGVTVQTLRAAILETSGQGTCRKLHAVVCGTAVVTVGCIGGQVPLIGWIGRLDHQKGPDVALDAIPGLAARGCQVTHAPLPSSVTMSYHYPYSLLVIA